jgi:hypothetical protein
LTEEEEKELLDHIFVEAVEHLDGDSSEVGHKIKSQVPEKTRKWIKQVKQFNKHKELNSEVNNELLSPMDNAK